MRNHSETHEELLKRNVETVIKHNLQPAVIHERVLVVYGTVAQFLMVEDKVVNKKAKHIHTH